MGRWFKSREDDYAQLRDLELFDKDQSAQGTHTRGEATICISPILYRELKQIITLEYEVVVLEHKSHLDRNAIYVADKNFLSLYDANELASSEVSVLFIGEERIELPPNSFFLPWEKRNDVKITLDFMSHHRSSYLEAIRALNSEKNNFVNHLYHLCLSNPKLSHEDRRWLQDSMTLAHGQLLVAGSFEELCESIEKIAMQLRPNIVSLGVLPYQGHTNSEQDIFKFGLSYNNRPYVLSATFSPQDFAAAIFFYHLAKVIERSITFLNSSSDILDRWSLLHRFIHEIPFPVIFINADGEIIFHNKEYDQLELIPKESLKLNDGEMKFFSGKHYRIGKKSTQLSGETFHLVTFFKHDAKELDEQLSSSEELGIISSSIAHELNNPVAGILAATSLLELDEEMENQDLVKVAEIKSSARRIKQLVDIFLGFSRGKMSESKQTTLQDCLCRAFDLLRYRMAEMNINLEFIYSSKASAASSRKVNESIYSMIFYLICSEILNISSHAKLIENGPWRLEKLFVEEDERFFSLKLNECRKVYERLQAQKLCLHLLQLERIKLSVQDNKLVLYYPLES